MMASRTGIGLYCLSGIGLLECCACRCNESTHPTTHSHCRWPISITFSVGWLNCSCTPPWLAGAASATTRPIVACHISSGAMTGQSTSVCSYVSAILRLYYW